MKETERPHDNLEVALPEGIAVVGVVVGEGRLSRIEVPGPDLLPRLAERAEVAGQVETGPKMPTPEHQTNGLHRESHATDGPDKSQTPGQSTTTAADVRPILDTMGSGTVRPHVVDGLLDRTLTTGGHW